MIELTAAKVEIHNLRDYAVDHRGSVDSRPYGGGHGMLLRPEPLAKVCDQIFRLSPQRKPIVISTRPGGVLWQQKYALEYTEDPQDIIFICGRFEGIDQRFIDLYVDREVSVGEYILAGGELPCLSICESIARLLPHVLDQGSTTESYSKSLAYKVEYPQFSRPAIFNNIAVPGELTSGSHKNINEWKQNQLRENPRSPENFWNPAN